ncbi:hypothetical protein ACTXG6_06690 [Pseudonocardia sp. Cha107L01]|uniref:hypothetical protein n=1 Tax=Pseudonocardia sp. Cha107L01 TaxID=3457576 RepID=UPI00403EBB50
MRTLAEELGSICLARGASLSVTAAQVVRPHILPGTPYRADLLAATAESLPKRAEQTFPVAVFDGPVAILRWRNRISARATVMLLDRSAPSADAAVEAVLADRARSLSDAEDLLTPTPAGVEVLAYLEQQ